MIRLVRRTMAAPLRWIAVAVLLDTRLSNWIARTLLVASAWIQGPETP